MTTLSLRAWAPVFESIRSVLSGSGVYELQYPLGWATAQEAAVGEACDSGAIHVWVAEVDAAVAGFAAVRLHEEDGTGEIYMLAVDPDHQRTGIAAALTGVALDWMRAGG